MNDFVEDEAYQGMTPWSEYEMRIRRVVVEDGVTSLSPNALRALVNLTSVTLPDTLRTIGFSAFCMCSSLESIELPDSVESIGNGAFEGSERLSSVKLPKNITELPDGIFMSCCSLIHLDIPEGVERIGKNALSTTQGSIANPLGLQEITIPSSVKIIDTEAFSTSSLESVYIPDTVEQINGGAFSGAYKLSEIKISPDNPYFTVIDNVLYDKECKRLISYPAGKDDTVFTVPDGVESIENNAFMTIFRLREVVLPETVRRIGDSAFSGSMTEKINLPDGITEIGADAFSCCRIKNIHFPASLKELRKHILSCTPIEYVIIPETVETIDCPFNGCDSLSDIYCYADPEKLEWNDLNEDYYLSDDEQTIVCHVKAEKLKLFESRFASSVNAVFTGDLTVGENVSGVKLDTSSAVLPVGNELTLTAVILPETAVNKNILWSSSDESVVTVSGGRITAIAPGKAVISAVTEDGNFKAECRITVPEHHEEKEPTCTGRGNIEYWSADGKTYGDQYCTWERDDVFIDPIGHFWEDRIWEWQTYTDVTVTLVCCMDESHKMTAKADVEMIPDDDGVHCTFVASIEIDGLRFTSERPGLISDADPESQSPDVPEPSEIPGDIDGDGRLSANDALMILRASVGAEDLDTELIPIADIDGDNLITANDALSVLRQSAGL